MTKAPFLLLSEKRTMKADVVVSRPKNTKARRLGRAPFHVKPNRLSGSANLR